DEWKFPTSLTYLHNQLAALRVEAGRPREAIPVYRDGVAWGEKAAKIAPPGERGHDHPYLLAHNWNGRGRALQLAGGPAEAEKAYRRALGFFEKLTVDHDKPHYKSSLAQGHVNLATVLEAAGRFEEAERAYRRAIALREELAEKHSKDAGYAVSLARTHD